MSKFFGKTWWGQQWLNSLSNIDYSNRLPRGSTYARNGSVEKISIEGNTITATVKGSRPSPYKVVIIIPPFFERERKQLIKAVAERPVIISKLLNRELDPEILDIAERKGLRVFPRQWTDLKMQCDCPDWATPCKHLAAIIYKVSSEIDNNPFLVFELHNVDLVKELEKENIHIQQAKDGGVPLYRTELEGGKKQPARNKTAVAPLPDTAKVGAGFQSLNFSILTPLTDPLIQLLGDAPVFYTGNGNFREKYAASLQKAVRNAQKIIAGKASLAEWVSDLKTEGLPGKQREPRGVWGIGHHTVPSITIDADSLVKVKMGEEQQEGAMEQLLAALWQIPPAQLPDYQPSVAALRTVLLLNINLLANGAVVPQILKLDEGGFVIRWLPALLSEKVQGLTDRLVALLPAGLLLLPDGKPVMHQPVVNLLSVVLTELVCRLSDAPKDDLFLDLFFRCKRVRFNQPAQEALPGSIHAWLQRYYLTQGRYRPSIIVEEQDNEAFQVTIHIEDRDQPLEKPVPLRDVTNQKKYEKLRFDILQSVAQLSNFIPGLDQYINSPKEHTLTMNRRAFAPFLINAIPAIRLLNIHILLPKSLQDILRPQPTIHLKKASQPGLGLVRLTDLLDFEWQVAVGDEVISEAEFRRLLQNSEGLIRYKSDYIYVSPGDLEKLHKHFSGARELSAFEMLRAALSNEYYGATLSRSEEVTALIHQLTEQTETPLPAGLRAQLRPYQHRGFSWMYRNTRIGFGSVIADDMGLGKTLQVITTLLTYKQEGLLDTEKALVVCPTGLLSNWQSEFEKFSPSLRFRVYHGPGRKLEEDFDVLLTSYGVVRSDSAKLRKVKWHAMVIDEAQNIKNYEAEQSKAVKSIPAGTFIAMSGTPVENRLSELWSIMDFCNRGFLGTLSEFRQTYSNPIQNQHDEQTAAKLRMITAPFLMRRLKSDKTIIDDLPDKIEIDCFTHLTKQQASLYEKVVQKALQEIEDIKPVNQRSLFERQGLVLQMILALKQICNHPTQFLKNNVLDASLSGKMDLLFTKLETILEANEKVLIFSQFTEMGELLRHFIAEKFEAPLFYHGKCSLKQRKEMVQAFQLDRADKIFVLSLKAAGTGLNLTAANHVIHYDLWWNPAVEAQATDRAYRIGQKSNVMVHRFITKGTFEERINEMIQQKKALADLTVGAGENWIGNLSNTELKDLFLPA